jgi:hypothetical protein
MFVVQRGFKKAQIRGGDGLVPGSYEQSAKLGDEAVPAPFLNRPCWLCLPLLSGLPPPGEVAKTAGCPHGFGYGNSEYMFEVRRALG